MNYSKNRLIPSKKHLPINLEKISAVIPDKPLQVCGDRETFQKNIHLFINRTHHNLIFCDDEKNSLDEMALNKLKHLESVWINQAKQECEHKYDLNQNLADISVAEINLKKHAVYNHELYEFFSTDAEHHHFKKYIQYESVLNLEFFDYLALSLVGSSEKSKCEIVKNLWDEAGRGDVSQSHTNLFKRILKDLEIDYNRNNIITNMPWEALAGINLFTYLSYHPHQKMKYFGLLAATEMLDPFHYNKLITGINRLYPKNNINYIYYSEHESVDVLHAKNWLQKIILPELIKCPYKTKEFWLGFYMRLDSTLKYYNRLFKNFTEKRSN